MERKTDISKFVHQVGKLKQIERAGWKKRGIKNPESIADHSFRMAVLALILSDSSIDGNKAVKMALIHDLAESKVGDITPSNGISEEDKHRLEEQAMVELCSNLDDGGKLVSLWREFEKGETKEAQFVRKLDKLEMMFQAHEYGEIEPEIDLSEFWNGIENFQFGELQELFGHLKRIRSK